MLAYCHVSTDNEEQLLNYENQVRYYLGPLIENIFNPTPKQRVLRGGLYLSESLRNHFERKGLLKKIDEFEIELIKPFKSKTSKSIFDNESVFVEEYTHRGMSSGNISIDEWIYEFIPLLIERFINHKKRKSGEKL